MRKNKIIKIIISLLILLILFNINAEVFGWSSIIKSGQDFIDAADEDEVSVSVGDLQNVSSYLYNVLLAAGVLIAVVVAIILGIQFMIGGAEGQAKVKEMLVPFIVGCVVVFGGFAIWKLAVNLGKRVDSAVGSSYVYELTDEEERTFIAMK